MLRKLLVVCVLALAACCASQAQEVIENQPSADITAKGHVFVRFDEFYTQSPAFYNENFNVAVGIAKNLEVSLNNTNAFNRAPQQDDLVLGFKYAPVKTNHFEIFVGDQFVQPLTNKVPGFSQGDIAYEGAAVYFGNWRFTGGSFQSHNAVQVGNRAGGTAGVEWTAVKFKNGWSLAPGIDWASGSGSNGYTSLGLSFNKGNFFLCPGYMIGNPDNSNGAHQSFVMVGYTF